MASPIITPDTELYREGLSLRSRTYVAKLHSGLSALEKARKKTPLFSVSESFLKGQFASFVSPVNLNNWLISSARATNSLSIKNCRIVPLIDRPYSQEEVNEIKFGLHTLLCLGATVYLPVTTNVEFATEAFGESFAYGGKSLLIFDHNTNPSFHTSSDVEDMFSPYAREQALKKDGVFVLRYGINSLTAGVRRKEKIKEKYGEFLYFLQGGKCAISGDPLESHTMEIDHIFPASKGGTNSIINLQATSPKANGAKSNQYLESDSRVFSDVELEARSIFYPTYEALNNRKATRNPLEMNLL